MSTTAHTADHVEVWGYTPATLGSMNKSQSEQAEKENLECLPGFIFLCSGKTKPECYIYRVFGLPKGQLEVVEKIKPGTKLFLFDFELKLMYGVYEATSSGKMDLEPLAFGRKFPAQVKFRIFKECLPLPEKSFKQAIKNNYEGMKFKPELSKPQVRDLLSLFAPLGEPSFGPPVPSLLLDTIPKLVSDGDPYKYRAQLVHAPAPQIGDQDLHFLQHPTVDHQRQRAPYPYTTLGSQQSSFGQIISHATSTKECQSLPCLDDQFHFSGSQQPYFTKGLDNSMREQQSLPAVNVQYHIHDSQQVYSSTGLAQGTTATQHQTPYYAHYSQWVAHTGLVQRTRATQHQSPYYVHNSQQVNSSTGLAQGTTAAQHQRPHPVHDSQQLYSSTGLAQGTIASQYQGPYYVHDFQQVYSSTGLAQGTIATQHQDPYYVHDSQQVYSSTGFAQGTTATQHQIPHYGHDSQKLDCSTGLAQGTTATQHQSLLAPSGPYNAFHPQQTYFTEGLPLGMTALQPQSLQVPADQYGLSVPQQQYYHAGLAHVTRHQPFYRA